MAVHDKLNTTERPPLPSFALLASAAYLIFWLVAVADQVLLIERIPVALLWGVHLLGVAIGGVWLRWATRPHVQSLKRTVCVVHSGVYVVWWQAAVFITDALYFDAVRATLAKWGTIGLFLLGLGWFVWWVDQRTRRRMRARPDLQGVQVDLWRVLYQYRSFVAVLRGGIWSPFDLRTWYYGRAKKLNQSIYAFTTYSALFLALFLLISQLQGCREIYEMPSGGGEQEQIVQTIKVQKIIRKRFVVNPYSAILFQVPNIDETVQLNLNEITKHQYEVGYGQGEGAGFSGGTFRGKVRLIRLEYSGGDWDQDFGIGGDLNMLTEYGIRTKHKIEKRTESRRITQLKNFPVGKSPPMVYMTGQKSISVSNNEIKILREYLVTKHGMIFGDNGGSRTWENQFFSMMNRVLPDVRPVPIPLDDQIHRIPYQIPFLPYVAPHGSRKEAMGWYKEGRWLAYYHPGDIGDAWSDGHAGVKPEVWEACYQLGTNVIFYAHAEYNKWLDAQKKKES